MAYYARLQHGSKYINLDDETPFCLAQDWQPPGVNRNTLISSGTMANQYAGGEFVYEQLTDRSMTIPIQVKGGSNAETHNAIRQFDSFVARSLANKKDKLYFIYAPSNAVPYAPKWGQQFYKYEIKANLSGELWSAYGIASVKAQHIEMDATFAIAPAAIGQRQRVGSATGSVLEMAMFTEDGASRGLALPKALTANLVTNPIFGHATYDTGWTAGAGLEASKNTDSEFIAWGDASAKLVNTSGAAAIFYQSLTATVASYFLTAYIKMPDGSTPSGKVDIWYDSAQTTTYQHMGNGIYKCFAGFTGVASPINSGVRVLANQSCYVLGVQLEAGGWATPLCHGNMLDCSWAGTAHESTSARTAARLRIQEAVDVAAFSLVIGWEPDNNNTSLAADIIFIDTEDGSSGIRFFFQQSSNTYRFTDGTNTIASAATTFARGTKYVFHLVAKTGSMKIYRNGVEIATGTTYTPPSQPTYMYVGSSNVPGNHTDGYYSDLRTWDIGLSATEVLAHYTDIAEHIGGGDGLGQQISPIPWAWFDQGDDTLDNDYTPGSSLYNFMYASGIPGNLPAETEWFLNVNDASFGDYEALFLALQEFTYKDMDNTYRDNAFATGAAATSINTTATVLGTAEIFSNLQYGRNFYLYIRVIDAGSDLQCKIGVQYSGLGNRYYSDTEDIDPHTATYYGFLIGPVTVGLAELSDIQNIAYTELEATFLRSVAGAANVTMDYAIAMADPLKIFFDGDMSTAGFILNGKRAWETTNTNYAILNKPLVTGKEKNLSPNVVNQVFQAIGDDGKTNATTTTVAYSIWITPRWALV